MAYKLLMTEEYEKHYHAALNYIVYRLHNADAARHLMDEVDKVYALLADTPHMYSISNDHFLRDRGYRQAPIKGYNLTYTIEEENAAVYLIGFSHQRQDQANALLPSPPG